MNTAGNRGERQLLRVVLDTNVFISAFLSPKGSSGRAWELARGRKYRLVTSPYIVTEVAGTLRRRFSWSEEKIVQRLKQISRAADIVQPTTSFQVIRDPKDNPIVECAVDGKAVMIVSLDKDLLALKSYNNIPVLHVVELLRTLGK